MPSRFTFYFSKPKFKKEEIMLKLSNGHIFPNKGTFKYTDNSIDKSSNSINIYVDFENFMNSKKKEELDKIIREENQ